MNVCGICGLAAHAGNCIPSLKREVARLQAALDKALENTVALDLLDRSKPLTLLDTKSNGFDKKAYQREYMRARRAKQSGAEHG